MISLVTFTGIDERTDLTRVREFVEKYRFVEFGVLLSLTPEDKDARYMYLDQIRHVAEALHDVPLALHVCGSAVQHLVFNSHPDVVALAAKFGRVQLNFNAKKAKFTSGDLESAMTAIPGKVITQHFPGNTQLVNELRAPNHQVLYDTSGGSGRPTQHWLPPFERKATGYAGGLGPEGIHESLEAIANAAGTTPVWIDMESRVRTDGYLNLDKCAVVAEAVLERVRQGKAETINSGAILE